MCASSAIAQTTQPNTAPDAAHPTVNFPLRHGYMRLHPDRVTVLEPRFDASPAESMKVLVVFSGGAVMPYDPVENRPLWPAALKCPTEPALLVLNQQHLIFATTTQVICAARSNGDVLWRFGEKTSTNPDDDPEWQVMLTDFAFAADRLICANDRRELTCLNIKDGALVWRVPDGPSNPGYVTADAKFVVSYDENAVSGSLTSRHLETGNKFKTVSYDRETILQFIRKLSDTRLLAVTSKQLVSFDSGSLAVNWRVTDCPVIFTSTLLIDGGNIIVSDDGKTVTRHLAETGERKWRSKRVAGRNDNVLWTDSTGATVIAATPYTLAVFDAASGRELWRTSGKSVMNEQAPAVIQDAILTYERISPTTRPASSQPAEIRLLVRSFPVQGKPDSRPADSDFTTESLGSFGGLHVRNHAVIVLDGNRLLGYIDASVKPRP